MHIALFGGSFDPVHNGHLYVARAVKKILPFINEVQLLPCYSHPFDKKMSLSDKRLAMCNLVRSTFINVNDYEIIKKGTSYTIDTLKALSKKYPKNTYYFIMGSDQLAHFHKWKDYKILLNKFNLIIFPRNIAKEELIPYTKKMLNISIVPPHILPLITEPIDISSTQVRMNLSRNADITHLVPQIIKKYILHTNMYKNSLPSLDSKIETKKITGFLKKVFKNTNIQHVVIGLSGGIDSALSFKLLTKVLKPENIHIAHLYYHAPDYEVIKEMVNDAGIPEKNQSYISIKKFVDEVAFTQQIKKTERLRIGNIAARMRMILLFDLAKKLNALVCGTENKTEHLLGYYTRFGDAASDIEPISHLYKTQVYELSKHLEVPEKIIQATPSANLWKGQTDEGEFGFSYEEADQVLYLHFDQKKKVNELIKLGFKNAKMIIERSKRNNFKKNVPYHL